MATLNTTNIKHGSSSSNNIVLASDGKVTFPQNTGNILQVVSTNVDGTSSYAMSNQNSYYEITALTTNITTTAANSKILVSAGVGGEGSQNDHQQHLRFGRVIGGSLSIIFKGADASSRTTCIANHQQGYFATNQSTTPSYNSFTNMLDSPSQAAGTTITYKFFVASSEGPNATYYLNRSVTDSDNASFERFFSHLTLMEVAA